MYKQGNTYAPINRQYQVPDTAIAQQKEEKLGSIIGDLAMLILIVAIIYYLHPIIKPLTRKLGERFSGE